MPKLSLADKIYNLLNNEQGSRVCKGITDDACEYVPSNFFKYMFSKILTKAGDALSSPKTVLTWLMSFVGAPAYLIGLLVPIRESGSLIPQFAIANYIQRMAIRKWVWVIGGTLQFAAIAGIGLSAFGLKGTAAGWTIVALLVVFSVARGMCSVASKDVLGKTVPKTRRGFVNGLAASAAGFLTVAFGAYMAIGKPASENFYAWLIIGAGSTWIAATLLFISIKEFKGETEKGGSPVKDAVKSFKLFSKDKPFRNFVIARSLFLGSALSAPYYVLLAHNQFGSQSHLLGMFIVANGIAQSLSAIVWGKFADYSSRKTMMTATAISALLGIAIFLLNQFLPSVNNYWWLYPAAFFILGIAHSGVRLGRKTFVVDLAGGTKRTDYVAVSNSAIGIILLFTGFIGSAVKAISPEGIILAYSIIGIIGIAAAGKLPEVEG